MVGIIPIIPAVYTANKDRKDEAFKAKRGRPRKDIDAGVIFHMIKNNAPIAVVARYVGVHRDTLYENFLPVIEEARIAHKESWGIIAEEMFRQFLEEKRLKRLKEEAKPKKRKYQRRNYYWRW